MRFDFLALAGLVGASTLTPPVLPLIVRNPYLSTWLGNAREAPWEHWPIFYTGATMGFSVMAAVPSQGKVYPLLGRPQDFLKKSKSFNITYPEYLGATFDASTTNLTYLLHDSNDSVRLTLSFLSPLTPSSTLRQSIPAAYLTISAEGVFDVDVYTDINIEWITGNRGNDVKWQFHDSKSKSSGSEDKSSSTPIRTWKIERGTQQLLTEFRDRAEWGTLHFSGPSDARYQSGDSPLVRQYFAETGSLANSVSDARDEHGKDDHVFAFAKSFKLGGKGKKQDSVLLTIALIQDPVVQFASARGLTLMKPLWASYFPEPDKLIEYHYNDYDTAASLAKDYSDTLAKDAFESGSSEYQDIAALSARQVLGATQFSGTPDDPIIFLKEISSNGNFQTVDVIFPAFPFFLYTNPKWLAYLLEPLLEHQGSGQYPNKYSMHDLGTHFPNATGHGDGRDEYMPVEECGNMLIMGLALANSLKYDTDPAFVSTPANPDTVPIAETKKWANSVDSYGIDVGKGVGVETGPKAAEKWLTKSYKLWDQWTGYLVRESLIPANQLSTDDFAGWLANQTNLALKGIIGIRAMSEIADIVGKADDAKEYRKIADDYIDKWQEYGLSRDGTHAKVAYTWYGSWTTIYNLYADSLLCFHIPADSKKTKGGRGGDQKPLPGGGKDSGLFVPDKIYQIHSDWYSNVLQRYGLPLDSRHLYTKSDWEFFAAAITSKKTRTEILNSISKWVNETTTDRPLTDLYDTEGTGHFPGPNFFARPVVGGHFAFLALERACGGKAVEGLKFLDEREPVVIDIEQVLKADMPVQKPVGWGGADL